MIMVKVNELNSFIWKSSELDFVSIVVLMG